MDLPDTLGGRATQALIEARAKAGTLPWPEVARIIDQCASAQQACTAGSQSAIKYDRKKIPPPPEHVTAYSAEIGYPLDGQKWCDSYAQKGWLVGKAKMKDWQAAVRNWKSNGWGQGGIALGVPGGKPKNYSQI
jgi:hypothetical protein